MEKVHYLKQYREQCTASWPGHDVRLFSRNTCSTGHTNVWHVRGWQTPHLFTVHTF